MTKADLIAAISEDAGINKTQANAALDSVLSNITASLKRHEKVTLVGFGTFQVSHRDARTGRDPRTGNPIQIAASVSPKFKAGKNLKEAVNS